MRQRGNTERSRIRMVVRVLWVAVLLLAVFFVLAGTASAKPAPVVHVPIVYYVDSDAAGTNDGLSWVNAFTDLQSALSAAVAGDDVWVAAGTYVPSALTKVGDARSATFSLKSGVDVYGGFSGDEKWLKERGSDAGLTVLSGDLGTDGRTYRVLTATEVTGAVLDCFSITAGKADGAGITMGGGLYSNKSAFTISNCIFHDNMAKDAGGGLFNYQGALTITGCLFEDNQAGSDSYWWGKGGGLCNSGNYSLAEMPTVITGCTFRDNHAYTSGSASFSGGGGMGNFTASPIIERCTFDGNWGSFGGGMYNYASWPTVTGCLFKVNEAFHGAGMLNDASAVTISDCVFNGNCATEAGAGIYYDGGRVNIRSSTFYKNGEPGTTRYTHRTYYGGAIYMREIYSLSICNVVFSCNAVRYDGGAVEDSLDSSRFPLFANCLFYGNTSLERPANGDLCGIAVDATNIFGSDPLLVDPDGGDFRLAYDSPCIDTGYYGRHGNVVWTPVGTNDFYGDKRVRDGDADGTPIVDIGATEYIPNLPDLRPFIEDLAAAGTLDEATATRLLAYVDEALAASGREAATAFLEELIADVQASLGGTDPATEIVNRTEAVIESLD